MNNAETAQMYAGDVETENAEMTEALELAKREKQKAREKFLKDAKCFKDLSVNAGDDLNKCIEYGEKYIYRLIQTGGPLTIDFLAGMRTVLEMFAELPEKWDNTLQSYNKGE